jgi:ABC-type multidrug transport system ATPase subunit
MFDKIGILSMGEIVYFGKADQMVPYFGSLGFPCPTYANPLDHYGNTVQHNKYKKINSNLP